MRAIVVDGGDLKLRDVAVPEPAPGEVRVRVRAFGVNRADLLQRAGRYPAPPGAPRDILGLEFAGEVDLVAAAARPPDGRSAEAEWTPGARVMGITAGGAYAEYVVVPANHLLPVPAGYSFAEAAAVPEAFVTAYDALERARVTATHWVLVHAIGSGVGTAALQLAQARGARCIGTSRTREKLHRALELGLDIGIDTTADDVVADVRRATGEGADAAVDLVGGPMISRTLEALRPGGRLVLVGLTAGRRADVDLGVILTRRLSVEGTVLRSRSREEKAGLIARVRAAVIPLLEARTVRPIVDRTWPFAAVEEAHATMMANANFGKLVVEVG
jgi:putative PIG3 family NAD(P)H quinone oxidoreductase